MACMQDLSGSTSRECPSWWHRCKVLSGSHNIAPVSLYLLSFHRISHRCCIVRSAGDEYARWVRSAYHVWAGSRADVVVIHWHVLGSERRVCMVMTITVFIGSVTREHYHENYHQLHHFVNPKTITVTINVSNINTISICIISAIIILFLIVFWPLWLRRFVVRLCITNYDCHPH